MTGLLRFGIFKPPHHRPDQSPSRHFQADIDDIVFADSVGFDEAWIGEHHSGGWEIVSSPELIIAAASQRAERIKLATGVSSLSYQHPFLMANRAVQLDHMTRGRFIFGTGPGSYVTDALTMDVDTAEQRRMHQESLEAITALLRYDGPVTRESDWFRLKNAHLHLPTYSQPRFEIATTVLASPSGPTLAGKYGLSMISLGSTTPAGFEFLNKTWAIAEESARQHGQIVEMRNWRLVAPMHLAESEDQARRQVAYGLPAWVDTFSLISASNIPGLPVGESDLNKRVDLMNANGFAVIGTPDMAVAQIRRLQGAAPGFGVFVLLLQDWANPEDTKRSMDLFARYVMPEFQGHLGPQQSSQDRHVQMLPEIQAKQNAGRAKAVADYEKAQDAKKQALPG